MFDSGNRELLYRLHPVRPFPPSDLYIKGLQVSSPVYKCISTDQPIQIHVKNSNQAVLPFLIINYNVLVTDWDSSNVEDILMPCMFEDLYRMDTGEILWRRLEW